ncbi:hypothetical protein ELQ35_12225 [Peribacillus cavernae]|uniref:Spore coat protein n=1 Tax=Peribacillus cavernae TaxID=1674310 RepID=A0A3S1B4Z7_9BACI|nr:hypothetical protein [Peribacillus cavernae]MDQ0219093.1 hypothetical protein [Peribacillus cavernae]RUQ28672.1 hypothetical protein ELQ35_12225 [Peribacillus cavernae]
MQKQLGLHETLESHEILTFKNNCAVKSSSMMGLANDAELKNLLSLDVQQSKQEIEQLVKFLS